MVAILISALGALVLTTGLFAGIGHFVFKGEVLDHPIHLITMGVILSFIGQFGDLVISSIKRDLGIKDMGALLPGHGGLLDRFDSLLLVAPALFHYINYFRGFGLDAPRVRGVPPGTFAKWMKRRGKLGGQHKVPRVINDGALFADLRGFVEDA